ncbi:sterile alpha motif domain-containing protein 9-like [Trichomycterus rosablanca]|uniref:sterile alpha motif domain-containing protein 9-like n=1 Tax=Trichomycterus rosablanca TaxID=2290929 RepID=UPI002F35FC6E
MAETEAVEKNSKGEIPFKFPADIKDWKKEHVRDWIHGLPDVDSESANILCNNDITGPSLLLLEKSDLLNIGIKLGPAILIIDKREELKSYQVNRQQNPIANLCKPYPFNRFHSAHRYKENSILDVIETGPLNLIEPCHEYKAFVNFNDVTEKDKLNKFTDEVIRFASACMNSRTNGTIHFGVGDLPDYEHGQILGTYVENREAFETARVEAIKGHFEGNQINVAEKCIKPPRFVEVLDADKFLAKYVIEVDVEPLSFICNESSFHVYKINSRKYKKSGKGVGAKLYYIRDSSSSRNLLSESSSEEYRKHIENMPHLSQMRKEAEKKHLTNVKDSVQGSKLCEMLTGGSHSLDKSNFEQYILVTNKSHLVQRESLSFLLDLNLTAVLDFDPESADTGLKKVFEERNTNVHKPVNYKITEAVEDIACKLKLTRTTSWVFCNGEVNDEQPSDLGNWLREKGSSARDVVSFLCRKEVLPHKKFLVIFTLLSDVTDIHDPLLETFSMFWQELNGTKQILCICENESSYIHWNELINCRYSVDISKRCIYELSLAEINGTVLNLWSENRKLDRFLPGGCGKVLLPKKVEGSLDTLNVLCVNQCEGGNEDKLQLEESFYKGGKVSWWNFYFSEQAGSVPFIKRDKVDYIIDTMIPDMCSLRKACVRLNVCHITGCGGTTLAMHVLWNVKEKFRCAVLKNNAADYADVAQQVVTLLTFEKNEQQAQLPVLLMIDDFKDINDINDLQQHIETECLKKVVTFRFPQVILLNCMRTDRIEQTEATDDTVFIGNKLSENEKKFFEKKLEEIEKIYTNAETFYGFMILKTDFSTKYIQGVVKNTLKGFNFKNKHAQLIAVLVLLECYSKSAGLSVSVCEEFLGPPHSSSCKVEDGFEKFSTLVTRCLVESSVKFEAIKVIHSSVAEHCLEELTDTFNVYKEQIITFLITTDVFYSCIQGKKKLKQDVHNMLVKRSATSKFSPLIQDIAKETPGLEEKVLLNAEKRLGNNAVMFQLLSRYYYLKKKDYREANPWAKKARDLQKDSSYFCDTCAQVIKHELKDAISNDKDNPIKADRLEEYLKMAESATEVFKETQAIAKKEISDQYQGKRDFSPYNTAGHLGELQVAVMVIDILQRCPLFSVDVLCQILSGKTKIDDVKAQDPDQTTNTSYYNVLPKFEDLLYNLKHNMKNQFDFFDSYFVNLRPYHPEIDQHKLNLRQKTSKCFQEYANLFLSSESQEMSRNQAWGIMNQIEEKRLFLEKSKADSFSGLLDCFYSINSAENIEQIATYYRFILDKSENRCCKDTVNYFYANIVLSQVKPESRHLLSYKKLVSLLFQTLSCPTPSSESLPLHFIAVMMAWPETGGKSSDKLGSYITQMRNSFDNTMKHVCHGKRATIHFYLGRKTGYMRLIPQKDIDECVGPENTIVSQLQSGKLWKHDRVINMLLRVTGTISKDYIMAETSNANLKVEVLPFFKSQLGKRPGSRVSFFVGFSMNGPIAVDVQPVM